MSVSDVTLAVVVRVGCSRDGRGGPPVRRAAMALVFGLAALFLSTSPSMASPTVGETAPEFAGTDSKGRSHALADDRGSKAVLEWTNHECPYTVKHYQARALQALQQNVSVPTTQPYGCSIKYGD